jgi:hypothetical protein
VNQVSTFIGDATFRFRRLRTFRIILLATEPVVWNVMITPKATIRARVLPRMIFLEVRRLELRNSMLCMSEILRGGLLEISLDSLSCPICGVLSGRLLSERCMPK